MPSRITPCADEVKEFFAQIERFKSVVQLALQDDLMYDFRELYREAYAYGSKDALESY